MSTNIYLETLKASKLKIFEKQYILPNFEQLNIFFFIHIAVLRGTLGRSRLTLCFFDVENFQKISIVETLIKSLYTFFIYFFWLGFSVNVHRSLYRYITYRLFSTWKSLNLQFCIFKKSKPCIGPVFIFIMIRVECLCLLIWFIDKFIFIKSANLFLFTLFNCSKVHFVPFQIVRYKKHIASEGDDVMS